MIRNFHELLAAQQRVGKFVCVGLDSEYAKIPSFLKNGVNVGDTVYNFNMQIIHATKDLVQAYKPNMAFYSDTEKQLALKKTITLIRQVAPQVPVILDFKRGDIGNTNNGYLEEAFDVFDADAVTVSPYLGKESLAPFLARKEKGIIVLCRTSNPGAGEFQDMDVTTPDGMIPLYQYVAHRVANYWNENANCSLVVGATFPEELGIVREIIGDMNVLIPGVGAQGGDVYQTVVNGKNSHNQGMTINSSRGIIFATSELDFPEAARLETIKLGEQINKSLV